MLSRCTGCAESILHSFISASGVRLPRISPVIPVKTSRQIQRSLLKRHTGVARRTYGTEAPSTRSQEETESSLQTTEDRDEPSSTPKLDLDGADETLPWYLRINNGQQDMQPVVDRQQLPPLPDKSPPVLAPLLDFVYTDQGIDDVQLYDLRHINPPSALGSNLIMAIGTARSEKHLHVTADRLCRWLRSKHNLKPFADGLLGRNELKLKLRRRARKARLLSSVGATRSLSEDDGIRTGWICVNVGNVPLGDTSISTVEVLENGLGFRKHSSLSTIVVQLMTSEKREEIDLEGIWGGLADNELLERRSKGVDADAEDRLGSPTGSARSTGMFSATQSLSQSYGRMITLSQRRGMHTVLSRPAAIPAASVIVEPPSRWVTEAALADDIESAIEHGQYVYLRQKLLSSEPDRLSELGISSDVSKTLQMRSMNSFLRREPREKALKSLGGGSSDYASTQFLLSFYQLMPIFPTIDHLRERLLMTQYAVSLGHPGYDAYEIVNILRQIHLLADPVSQEDIEHSLAAMIEGGETSEIRRSPVSSFAHPLTHFGPIMSLLELAAYPALVPLDAEFLYRLLRLIQPLENEKPFPVIPGSGPASKATKADELQTIFETFGIFSVKRDFLQLLDTLAELGHWTAFWNLWYQAGLVRGLRTPLAYHRLFSIMADTAHLAACGRVLRDWVPEFFEVARSSQDLLLAAGAIRRCVLLVDPEIEQLVAQNPSLVSEWAPLWRRFRDDSLIRQAEFELGRSHPAEASNTEVPMQEGKGAEALRKAVARKL